MLNRVVPVVPTDTLVAMVRYWFAAQTKNAAALLGAVVATVLSLLRQLPEWVLQCAFAAAVASLVLRVLSPLASYRRRPPPDKKLA